MRKYRCWIYFFIFSVFLSAYPLKFLQASLVVEKPGSNSEEKILSDFFYDLFAKTSAGYVVFGDKPIYWNYIPSLQRAIPGSKNHHQNLKTLVALETYKHSFQQLDNADFSIVFSQNENLPSSNSNEFMIINHKAFTRVVEKNISLFKQKFGVDTTPEKLLKELSESKQSFSSMFGKDPILQGIVLGYGTDNAISFSRGSKLMEVLATTNPKDPPYQLPSYPKNEEEMKKRMQEHPSTRTQWKKIQQETQAFSFYTPKNEADHLKIPFSFHPSSEETKSLLTMYRKSQDKLDSFDNSENLLSEVVKTLGIKGSLKNNESLPLLKAFSKNEKAELLQALAKSLLNSFPEGISSSFIKGMQSAQIRDTPEGSELTQDIQFLDILRIQTITLQARKENSLASINFLKTLEASKKVKQLIPNKIYTQILEQGSSNDILSSSYETAIADYLLTDMEGRALVGSYMLKNPPEVFIKDLIPGLAHGIMGMKEGETREVYIHPDFAYGVYSDFGQGKLIKAQIKLYKLGKKSPGNHLPELKPVDVSNHVGQVTSCEQFKSLQETYDFFCGLSTWRHYKNSDLITLNGLIAQLKKISSPNKSLTKKEKELLLRLEWSIYHGENVHLEQQKVA